jgi:hypothetical protein
MCHYKGVYFYRLKQSAQHKVWNRKLAMHTLSKASDLIAACNDVE